MEEVKKFVIKDTLSGHKILIAQTDSGDYYFRDGNHWSVILRPIAECPDLNNSNKNCKGKCENVYHRESGILKCKDCGRVFY